MARRPSRPALTADQQADDLRALAETLAATDRTHFGATEFVVRDLVLGLGAKAVQAALAGRAKKVTTGAAAVAPPATVRPSSSGGSPAPSLPCSGPSA